MGPKKKAQFECKKKVNCLTCGEILLSENQRRHTERKHKGDHKNTKFRFHIDDSKQTKLTFARKDKNSNVAVDVDADVDDPPKQHDGDVHGVEEMAGDHGEAAAAGHQEDVHGGADRQDGAMAAAATKKKSDDDPYLMWHLKAGNAAGHVLDPRWVEERDKLIAQEREEGEDTSGQRIESSLKQYAERRTNIFGTGDDAAQETMIGKKIGDEEARPAERPGVWDGYSNTANSAANVSVEDQIAQSHRKKVI